MLNGPDRSAAWLMVWATQPAGSELAAEEGRCRGYLRTKKHQMGIPRGVVFHYGAQSGDLVGVYYDGHTGDLSDELSAKLGELRPPTEFRGPLHPNAKRPPQTRPPIRRSRNS